MSENVNLGLNGKFGKINLDNIKHGVKKSDMKTPDQIKLFEKTDLDQNGILSQDEIEKLKKDLGSYADNGRITRHEAKQYVKQQGLKGEVDKMEVFEFLKSIGVASENIEDFANSIAEDGITLLDNITYKPDADGNTVTETYVDDSGELYSKTIKNGDKTVTQKFIGGDTAKIKEEVIVENGVKTTIKYNDNGEIESTIREKGSVKAYIENGRVVRKETNKGNGLVDVVEYEYDSNGEIARTVKTNADGTKEIDDGKSTKTIAQDGSYTVENKETGEIRKFDKEGNEIVETPPEKSAAEKLKDAFGEDGKATATIEGKATRLTSKDYQGTIKLPKGAQMPEEGFPQELIMSLPGGYGGSSNPVMKLKLIDPENGIYESSAHDRNFQISVDEDGNVTVKAANVEELSGLLNSNLEKYRAREAEKRLQEQSLVEAEVMRGSTIDAAFKRLEEAENAFDAQLKSDGWAGKVADSVSVLWGSDNRAVKVRADIDAYRENLKRLRNAGNQGEDAFNTQFKNMYGIDYNADNVKAYLMDPTDANYVKAYGDTNDIARRVAVYNRSQQRGAATVKTVVVATASAAAAVATGGTSLIATAAVAGASTMAARTVVEVSDLATNDIQGDINAQSLNDISNQALKEGAIAAATAGILKGGEKIVLARAGTTAARTATTEAVAVRTAGSSATRGASGAAKLAAGETRLLVGDGTAQAAASTGAKAAGAGSRAGASTAGSTGARAASAGASSTQNAATDAFVSDMANKVGGGSIKNLSSDEISKLANLMDMKPSELTTLTKSQIKSLLLKYHPDRCTISYAHELTSILTNMLRNAV